MDSRIKRAGILSVYDKAGIIDDYVIYLASSLHKIVSKLIIVVNGTLSRDGCQALLQISDTVILRENKGFDGGAYKEILTARSKLWNLQEYDELILCNDTCYGPFRPLEVIWERMDQEESQADFWGMNEIQNGLTDHMQGYFLVFRKKLLEKGVLQEYFHEHVNENCQDLREMIASFEKGLFLFLREQGYLHASYIERNNLNIYEYGDVLLKEYRFPFLKKKCFDPAFNRYHSSLATSIEWIRSETDYPLPYLLNHAKRVYGYSPDQIISAKGDAQTISDVRPMPQAVRPFRIGHKELERFIKQSESVYLYGCGKYAIELYLLYLQDNHKLKGFLVSDNQLHAPQQFYDLPVLRLSELDQNVRQRIIVAAGSIAANEIRNHLSETEDVLFIC
ncbi:MAG: rhamnan synthesis F family protein [Lachnospiraceae bacterium]